jgi:hypothetical protein
MGLHAKVAKVLQSEHILEPLDDGIKDSGIGACDQNIINIDQKI